MNNTTSHVYKGAFFFLLAYLLLTLAGAAVKLLAGAVSTRSLSRLDLKANNVIISPRIKSAGARNGKVCNDKQRNGVFIAAVG